MRWLLTFEAVAGPTATFNSAMSSSVALTCQITILSRAPFRRFELLDERLEKELVISCVGLFCQDLFEDSWRDHKLACLVWAVCLDATSSFFQFCLAIVLEAGYAETMTTVSHGHDLVYGTLIVTAWALECLVTLLTLLCEAEFETESDLEVFDLL